MTSSPNVNDQNETVRPRLRQGVWRGLLFVGIIWSIAGSFYLLQVGQTWVFGRFLRYDWIPQQWLETRHVPATDCSAVIQKVPQEAPHAEELKRARLAAFELGLGVGATTALRNVYVPESEQDRQLRSGFALQLGVPVPEVPPLLSFTNALSEFQNYVLADPQCIGALLAKKYSPRDDALYRFGAFAGYNLVRIRFPNLDAMFVAQLRQFGRAAGLPQEVCNSFIDAGVDLRTALGRTNAYLQTEPLSTQR